MADYENYCTHQNGHSSSTNIIEYQRRAHKAEITGLRQQISKFSHIWVQRLNDLENAHENELEKVQLWMKKVYCFILFLTFKSHFF